MGFQEEGLLLQLVKKGRKKERKGERKQNSQMTEVFLHFIPQNTLSAGVRENGYSQIVCSVEILFIKTFFKKRR